MSQMFFGEVLIVFANADIQAAIGDQPALIERIFPRVPEGDEFVIAFERWKRKFRNPFHGFDGDIAR